MIRPRHEIEVRSWCCTHCGASAEVMAYREGPLLVCDDEKVYDLNDPAQPYVRLDGGTLGQAIGQEQECWEALGQDLQDYPPIG